MRQIWFTSDTHFGHANIIKYCNRPYENVQEMDETLISNWNKVVKEDDIVYHLGDFCLGSVEHYLVRLKGHITILKGDHDRQWVGLHRDSILRIEPPELIDEYGNDRMIVLCHYAMRSWYKSHYASWHLFGHHHGKLPPYGLSFDVGVDAWNYYPASLYYVAEKMATLKPIVDFRKEKNQ
jgi:calcineurin-like phosphoesterase family protein